MYANKYMLIQHLSKKYMDISCIFRYIKPSRINSSLSLLRFRYFHMNSVSSMKLPVNSFFSFLIFQITHVSEQSPKEFCLQSDDLRNAVNDFEDTWKKSLKKSYSSQVIDTRNGIKQLDNQSPSSTDSTRDNVFMISTANSDDTKESKLFSFHPTPSRSSSLSSVSSQSTSLSHAGLTPTDVSILLLL